MVRALVFAGVTVAAIGSAQAQVWTEPDPTALVGRWTGPVVRKQCAAGGGKQLALEVVRDGSGYRIDLAPVLDGLRAEVFVPIGGPTVEAQRDDLRAVWTPGKRDRATLVVTLGAGCQATATLRRDSLGLAACDEVVGLRAVAAACPTLAAPVDPSAEPALARLKPGRKLPARQRAAVEAQCRAEAAPLRTGLIEAGCVPPPPDPDAAAPIAECTALIATVVRALRCDKVPADVKGRMGDQVHILARNARVADPEARAALVAQCQLTQEEIAETLKLIGCKP